MTFVDYPGHLVAFVLLTVCGVIAYAAFRSSELCKTKHKFLRLFLMIIRYAVILLLLLILWNPSGYTRRKNFADNSIMVVFDTSRSMSVKDDSQISRLDKAINVFKGIFDYTETGSLKHNFYGFDSHVYYSGSTNLLRRWGSQTDMQNVFALLGKRIDYSRPEDSEDFQDDKDSAVSNQNSRISGIVIFTDGQVKNKGASSYASLIDDKLPLLIIGVGPREHHVDMAIESINVPSRVAIDSLVPVEVAVHIDRSANQPVTVELLKDDYVIDSNQIDPVSISGNGISGVSDNGDSESKREILNFNIPADRLGRHCYTARIQTSEKEINTENNIRHTMVEVIDIPTFKVLFYSRTANFNVGKIRQALARDPRIQLDLAFDIIRSPVLSTDASKACGYISLPSNFEEFCKYDLIILGPSDFGAWTNAQIDGLRDFVIDRGGGLVLLPARDNSSLALLTNGKLGDLLPVIFDSRRERIWPPNKGRIELPEKYFEEPVLSEPDLRLLQTPTSAYYRILDTKPAATVLAHVEQSPAIVIHRVGRGKVCLLNIVKLFLWYEEDIEGGLLSRLFTSLSSQLVNAPGDATNIEVFAERSDERSNKVTFNAYVCDKSYHPVDQANVLLTIDDRVLSMYPASNGYFAVEIDDLKNQSIVATVQAENNGIFIGERTVAVNLPPVRDEMFDTQLDEKFLCELATQVKGKYIYVDDLKKDVIDLFEARSLVGVSEQVTSLWPNWPLLLVLCALLSFAWFIRRSRGLV